MDEKYNKRIGKLKRALLNFLGSNGRYYGDLTRLEQFTEDLAQALNARLDQLALCVEKCDETPPPETPREKLANRFIETATKLSRGGRVDADMVDQFEASLDLLDIAADLKRQSETVKDSAETSIIKHKRGKS